MTAGELAGGQQRKMAIITRQASTRKQEASRLGSSLSACSRRNEAWTEALGPRDQRAGWRQGEDGHGRAADSAHVSTHNRVFVARDPLRAARPWLPAPARSKQEKMLRRNVSVRSFRHGVMVVGV